MHIARDMPRTLVGLIRGLLGTKHVNGIALSTFHATLYTAYTVISVV